MKIILNILKLLEICLKKWESVSVLLDFLKYCTELAASEKYFLIRAGLIAYCFNWHMHINFFVSN